MSKPVNHTEPKTQKAFESFCDQKSTDVKWTEDDITMLRRKGSTQQWNKRGKKWHLAGFS